MNSKERFLAVIKGNEPDRVPVFPLLMSFSAKRYGATYREFASNGHVLAESQLKIGNTTNLLSDMVTSGADLYNVDHMVDFQTALKTYGDAGKAFKGNLDPVAGLLQTSVEECERKSKQLVNWAKGHIYMLSPGCEVPADVSDEVFAVFCNAVK